MNACEPARTAPTGAPSPFVRSIHTLSNGRANALRRRAARHHGVHQTGAVHVARQSGGMPCRADLLDLCQGPAHATDDVGRLLDRKHPRAGHVVHRRPHGLANLVGDVHPARARERPHDRADQGRRAAGLVEQRVRRLVQQDLVPGPAVHREGDLVAHRAGWA